MAILTLGPTPGAVTSCACPRIALSQDSRRIAVAPRPKLPIELHLESRRRRGPTLATGHRAWGGPGRARAGPHTLSPPLISQALPATRPVLHGAVFLGVTIVLLPAAASRSALRAVACDRLRRT